MLGTGARGLTMRWRFALLSLLLTGIVVTARADPPNLLQNSGFEQGSQGWSLPSTASVVTPGHGGGSCVRVSNPTPQYSYVSQRVAVDGSQYRRITLQAWMRWSWSIASWKSRRDH